MKFRYSNVGHQPQHHYPLRGHIINNNNNNIFNPVYNHHPNTFDRSNVYAQNIQNILAQRTQLPRIATPKYNKIPELPIPILQNIVCTFSVGCPLDLKEISIKAMNSEYNPKRFSAVIMRIRVPRTTALIFSTGKIVCTGAKSEEEAKLSARKFARIIQKLGFKASFQKFEIENIVGSCDAGFPIRLAALQVAHNDFVVYEPENFPGLVYRIVDCKVVILIFKSGKVVLTGAKYKDQIDEAFNKIFPILKEFWNKSALKID